MVEAGIIITSLLLLVGPLTFMKSPEPPTAKEVVQEVYVILILWVEKPSLCEVRQPVKGHRSLLVWNPVALHSCGLPVYL